MKGKGFHNPLCLPYKLPLPCVSSAGGLYLLLLSTSILGMVMVEPCFLQGETSATCQDDSSWIFPEMTVIGITTASNNHHGICWAVSRPCGFSPQHFFSRTHFPRPLNWKQPWIKSNPLIPKMWQRNVPLTSPIKKHRQTDHFKPDKIWLL